MSNTILFTGFNMHIFRLHDKPVHDNCKLKNYAAKCQDVILLPIKQHFSRDQVIEK